MVSEGEDRRRGLLRGTRPWRSPARRVAEGPAVATRPAHDATRVDGGGVVMSVDHGVVMSAEQREVAHVGASAEGPVDDVVSVAPARRGCAPGVGAPAVAQVQRGDEGRSDKARRAAKVEQFSPSTQDGGDELRVAREHSCLVRGEDLPKTGDAVSVCLVARRSSACRVDGGRRAALLVGISSRAGRLPGVDAPSCNSAGRC